jgi:putative transposase
MATADVCRKHGISGATFYKWKSKFGGLDVSEVGGASAEGSRGREREAEAAAGGGDAGQRHAEGHRHKKILTPAALREAVVHLCAEHGVSQRRACSVLAVDRSAVRYRSSRPDDAAIRIRLRELAGIRRRFGYRRKRPVWHVLRRR